MRNRQITLVLFSLITFSFTVSGQKMINSPFSRFGIGSLEPAASYRSLGMGGTGTAIRSNNSVYFANPASYSSLDTNSFIFDFGIDYGINLLSDGTTTHHSEDLDFDHLLMGFPISKRIGFATGIVSVSNGYYKISHDVLKGDPDYDAVTGEYTAFHEGSGGISSFFLGSGIALTKNISLGANISFLFGKLNRSNDFIFADYYNVFHNNNSESLRLAGLNFNYGIQYLARLSGDHFLNAGASLSTGNRYRSDWETLSMRFNAYSVNDTLSYISDKTTKAYIPGTLRLGLSYGKQNKLTAAFDFIYTKWSKARIQGSDGYLADTKAILLGVEYIPDRTSNYSYFKRMEYRLGGHYEDNYLTINNNQVKEFGLSLGIGLPMPRSQSRTNIFIDYTRKYGDGGTIHMENCFTMGVSLNFYDWWFIKPKYN